MIKRTLYFTKQSRLSMKDQQLIVDFADSLEVRKVPIEDIGYMVIESSQISITTALIQALIENNVAILFCDTKHMPGAMLLNFEGNHMQSHIMNDQILVSEPLKKNIWKQIIEKKIKNQTGLLTKLDKGGSYLEPY